jgi:ubiquitin carboxyl-terminal hydrolase 4/11/15
LFALEEFNTVLEKELKLKKAEKGLAAAYNKLVTGYRSCGEKEIINPSEFKTYMGRRKDRFAGSAQQDAQELLTAFLEGINEEMTRIKVKPKYK